MNREIVEKELWYRIVQSAYIVFNELGPGYVEKIYERAMALILADRGHSLENQKTITIYFRDRPVGTHVLDLVVNNRVILELKAVSVILAIHKQQALSYLKATGLPLALIINFGCPRLQVARVVHTKATSIPR